MSGQIFISYRRDDTPAWARLLYDRLLQQFSQNEIFMDVDMDLGVDFVKAIDESVGSCDVLIAVIGRRWLTSVDEEGRRRLDNSEDFVRIEIATALKRGVRVIPVLVEGVSMPRSGDLPDDLKSLLRRQALEVSHGRFNADSERLMGAVERALEKAKTEQRQREEKERLEAERREREEKERFDALRHESEEKDRLEAERREREEKQRLEAEQRKREEKESLVEQRERDEKERLEVERRQREENDQLELEAERGKEQLQAEQREQKERLEKEPHLTGPARGLPRDPAIAVSPEKVKAPLWLEPKIRVILAACAGVAIAIMALTVVLSQFRDPSDATKEHPFVNSLGMRFVPVPGTNVLFSVWETRVKDYQTFCDETGKWWEKPRFQQTPGHPAVNVSLEDAKAFCEWLGQKEGKRYRLPTDDEWSKAVGIGDRENADATPKSKDMKIAGVFPWGEQWPPPNDAGNYFGEECKTAAGLGKLMAAGFDVASWPVIEGFNDEKVVTAAAASFPPNALGIYDLGGNVFEWCPDEYEPRSAWRVLRGGSWYGYNGDDMLSSSRVGTGPDTRAVNIGLRVVVEAGSGR